jgi:hypothetical protein
MTAPCAHGFPPGECLICQTLGTQPKPQVETSAPVPGRLGRTSGANAPSPRDGDGRSVRPDAVYPPGSPRRGSGSSGHSLLVLIAGVVAVGAAIWLLAGVAFALLHVLELLVVAVGAGWAGYRFGHWRGRRSPPDTGRG